VKKKYRVKNTEEDVYEVQERRLLFFWRMVDWYTSPTRALSEAENHTRRSNFKARVITNDTNVSAGG